MCVKIPALRLLTGLNFAESIAAKMKEHMNQRMNMGDWKYHSGSISFTGITLVRLCLHRDAGSAVPGGMPEAQVISRDPSLRSPACELGGWTLLS